MLPSNIWVSKELQKQFESLFKKRRVDLIPAICNGTEGFCMLSLTHDEMVHILGSFSRGVAVNATGTMTAQVSGTTILVDVASITVLS